MDDVLVQENKMLFSNANAEYVDNIYLEKNQIQALTSDEYEQFRAFSSVSWLVVKLNDYPKDLVNY